VSKPNGFFSRASLEARKRRANRAAADLAPIIADLQSPVFMRKSRQISLGERFRKMKPLICSAR
jgi:hypothetical protein